MAFIIRNRIQQDELLQEAELSDNIQFLVRDKSGKNKGTLGARSRGATTASTVRHVSKRKDALTLLDGTFRSWRCAPGSYAPSRVRAVAVQAHVQRHSKWRWPQHRL